MRQAEDIEKGLFAIALDDSGENTLRYGRMKYNGKLGYYTPDCVLTITDFVLYFTKNEQHMSKTTEPMFNLALAISQPRPGFFVISQIIPVNTVSATIIHALLL